MPSRAGALSSILPPLISVAAIKVSNCLRWALRRGKFSLPPSESSEGFFLRAVEVFFEITNALERGVISSWFMHSCTFSLFSWRRLFLFFNADNFLLFDKYSSRRLHFSLANSPSGNRLLAEHLGDLQRGFFLVPIQAQTWAQNSMAYDQMQRFLLIFQTKIHPLKLTILTIFSTKTKDKYLF